MTYDLGGRILKITRSNGDEYWLPDPNKMEIGIQDIDSASTGRSVSGLMFRDRVATKRKVSCSFPPMNDQTMKGLLSAMQDTFFSLYYYDPMLATWKTITCYVGDRTVPTYWLLNAGQTNQKVLWEGLSANFVER